MHNYNVGSRYTTNTKLGNWYEEKELDQFQFKEYLYQKEQGNNLTLNNTFKIGFSQQQVALTKKNDTLLAPGDAVQLFNNCTNSLLAYNINQAILGEQTYAVTTTPNQQPALRNVFKIQLAAETGSSSLRYGDKVRFTTTVNERKLYLQSLPVNPMRSSKFSRLQEVSVTATLNAASLWVFETVNAKDRFDSVGKPISIDVPLLIKHVPTSQWLASEQVKYVNDFGVEFQVFGKSYLSNNKTQNLFAQKEGHKGATNPLRSQGIQNEWRVITG